MARKKLLSVADLAEELSTGKATIKFLLKRFKKWLPHNAIDGQFFYPAKTIKLLVVIQENLEMGLLPSEIEKELDEMGSVAPDDFPDASVSFSQPEDIRLSNDGLTLLKSLFHDIGTQQKRIAEAHEKRAEAEERKAVAIEKRADAEEKKADAMNNIANALQEMNRIRAVDPDIRQVAHQAAAIMATDDPGKENISDKPDGLSNTITEADDFNETGTDLSSLLDEDDLLDNFSTADDLSDTLEQELEADFGDPLDDEKEPLQTDDLSLLIEENNESSEKISDKPDDPLLSRDETQVPDEDDVMDDLSSLLDETPPADSESGPLDNLSLLLDTEPGAEDTQTDAGTPDPSLEMDDLSALIGEDDTEPETGPPGALDDLSKLIDDAPDTAPSVADLDDLSLLIEPAPVLENETGASPEMDDLSKLIAVPETKEDASSPEKEIKETPEIKIDISPEDDLAKYKAAIMKIIIQMKSDGLDVEETTDRLNKNNIKTLSGKPEWNQKAISQIYKFIESAN